MAHHRCAHCRNPIRRGPGISAASADHHEAWFHPDCWAAVLAKRQQDYHQQIQSQGLEALIAPYVSATPAARTEVLPVQVPAQVPLPAQASAEVVSLDSARVVEGQVPPQKGRAL